MQREGAIAGPCFWRIFNRGHLIQLLIDPVDGRICDANDAACAFYGYALDELRTRRISEINQLSEQEIADELRRAVQQERSFFLFRHRLADGSIREVEVNSGPVELDGQQFLHSVVFDVTLRNAGLHESERLAIVLRSTADGVVVTDREGRIEVVNEAFAQITGYGPEEVLGHKASVLKSGVQDPSYYKHLWSTISAGESWRGVLVNRRRDGAHYYASMTISPLTSGQGYVAIQRDITEVVQARAQAEEAARAKSAFLANMSHEIRTPLNGIIGLAHLLEGTDLLESQREYTRTIRRAADALLGIVNDVLDFSKIEAGKLTLEQVPFDVASVARSVVGLVNGAAEKKSLALTLDVQEGLPAAVLGDPGRVQQILVNLVGNAVKFTERGEVRLSVRQTPSPRGQVGLQFVVQDTGIGISAEVQAALFTAFTQADVSTTRRFGGTGLGLAISQYLARAMNGSISVQSAEGQGSTFTLALNLHSADRDPPASSSGGVAAPVAKVPPGTLLLVAEDNPVNRMVAVRLLQRLGAEVHTADDGAAALAAAQSHPYQMIFMDLHMPVLDGLEVTRRLRADSAYRDLPIVALTAAAAEEDRRACLDAGMNDYLSKPFQPADLERLLLQYCGPRDGLGLDEPPPTG